jgi:hypothetical protein
MTEIRTISVKMGHATKEDELALLATKLNHVSFTLENTPTWIREYFSSKSRKNRGSERFINLVLTKIGALKPNHPEEYKILELIFELAHQDKRIRGTLKKYKPNAEPAI